MPQCCFSDPQTIFTYDVEDGAPLSAYFVDSSGNPGTTDVTVAAGHGINGSKALHSDHSSSAGYYAECSVKFPTNLDICGNPRREFAVGGYWNFINTYAGGAFYFIEIRNTGVTTQVVLSFTRDGRDLIVDNSISFATIFTVRNAFHQGTSTMQKIEVRGAVNTMDNNGNALADGWLEVRIDGVVYPNGSDADTFDPNAPADPCPTDGGVIMADGYPYPDLGSWDKVTFGTQGDLDCPYIKEVAAYCDDNPVLSRPGAKCDPAGPGGDGTGPRIIHPGGLASPTYVAPTGGGTPATASDPADPQTLTDADTVLYSLDLTLCDSTVLSVGQAPIVCAGRPYVQPRVVRFGPVEYPLSDRSGNVRGQVWDVDIADHDGVIRGYLDSPTNRFYTRWEGKLYAETDIARLAGTPRQPQARGRVVSVTTPDDLIVRISFADELTRQDSATTLERELPRFTIGDIFHGSGTTATGLQFLDMSVPVLIPQANPTSVRAVNTPPNFTDSVAQPPEHVRDQAMPCLLGECSDEWRSTLNPPVTPVGICKVYLLGDVLLKGSELWQCYLISQYAIKAIVANGVFGSNLATDCPGSVRLDLDALTDSFLVPGQGNWASYFSTNYIDFTWGPQQYRCTVMFARGPISQQHVDGIVPISVNAWGIEEVGDGSGEIFDDVAYQLQWWLDHPVIQQTLVGNWNAVATFADGVAKIRTSSFDTVKAIHDARLGTRYRGRMIIDQKKPAKDWLAAFLTSGNMSLGINQHGQAFVTTLDDGQSLASLPTYTDQQHIADGSFKVTSERSGQLENAFQYDWGPEPATGRTTGAPVPAGDATSQTNWGVSLGQARHYLGAGRQDMADDVAGREIIRTKDGITEGTLTIDLAGADRTSGEIFRVTDFRGLGTSGWTDRVLLITSRTLNPNVSNPPQADDLTMAVHWEDMQQSLAAPAGMVGGGVTSNGSTTSRVGFHPVGTTAGADGWTVGDTASGNGWRVG